MGLKPVLRIVGFLLLALAAGMLPPMMIDFYGGSTDWKMFFLCLTVTAFFGGALVLTHTSPPKALNRRQAFMLIGLGWLFAFLFGSLPFHFSKMPPSDAFFESMSGITTTSMTVIQDLTKVSQGLLLWRAIIQWLGGLGIILMAISVLPYLNIGGMQLFRNDENEKALPRTIQLASQIALIYLVLTLLCAVSYRLAGMGSFDALAHALTTLSTGGFSTHNASFSHYNNGWVEMVAVVFMLIGGMPFALYFKTIAERRGVLLRDPQVRCFLAITGATALVASIHLCVFMDMPVFTALWTALFHTISLITGTGFVNGQYNLWGGFFIGLFFFMMMIGACAGSTSGGLKIFRFQALYAVATVQIKKIIYPNGLFIAEYNKRPISDHVVISIVSFFFVFAVSFGVLAGGLSYVGLDPLSALSAAASALSNVGINLCEAMSSDHSYQSLSDAAKWILILGMLLGRLEIFTVLVLCSAIFWKQ